MSPWRETLLDCVYATIDTRPHGEFRAVMVYSSGNEPSQSSVHRQSRVAVTIPAPKPSLSGSSCPMVRVVCGRCVDSSLPRRTLEPMGRLI